MSNISPMAGAKTEHYPLQYRAVLTFPTRAKLEAFIEKYENWLCAFADRKA